MSLLVALLLAIGCLTAAQDDPPNNLSNTISENDEIAYNLKEALDNLEDQDAASFLDNVEDLAKDTDSMAADSSEGAMEKSLNDIELDAISKAFADIMAGRAGDLTNDGADETENQNTGTDLDDLSAALQDFLAGSSDDSAIAATNEITDNRRGSGRFSRGREHRRRLRDRRVKAAPTVETETESSGKQERSGR